MRNAKWRWRAQCAAAGADGGAVLAVTPAARGGMTWLQDCVGRGTACCNMCLVQPCAKIKDKSTATPRQVPKRLQYPLLTRRLTCAVGRATGWRKQLARYPVEGFLDLVKFTEAR